MADYWKSNDRKFCDFCKCWITDNKPSIAFHENGKRHKANVAKRISDISRNSAKSEKEKQKMDQEIRKMEEAALKSYTLDIHSKADMTARTINAFVGETNINTEAGTSSSSRYKPVPGAQVDPLMPPEDFDAESEDGPKVTKKSAKPSTSTAAESEATLWVEALSPEGHTYYWNVKSNESVWEPPKEGYMTLDEYNRINEIAVKQQQINLEKESKIFQEKAPEMIARYNRERLKLFRRNDPKEEIEKQKKREKFKTEDDMQGRAAAPIGEWQPVIEKKVEPIDLELPKQDRWIPQVVSEINPEPPVKKFKEKQIEKLDSILTLGTSTTFKKRKINAKSNSRQRLDVD